MVNKHEVNLAVSFLSKFELMEVYAMLIPCAMQLSFLCLLFFNLVAGMPVLDLLFYSTAAWEKKQQQQTLTCRGSGLEGFHSPCFAGGMFCGLAPTRVVVTVLPGHGWVSA